tara:strand:+ start:302 stop:1051 length:750 start_codon:yes stop_codon:yes gene_type:complete
MTQVHTTDKSRNGKVGRIPVTTSEASTCPVVCPFNHANDGGCYADAGPLKLHWDKVSRHERGDDWDTFITKVESFALDAKWRHNQAGDLPGDSYTLDASKCADLARANGNRQGFTYTHYDVLTDERNRDVVRDMNTSDFTVNLSGNNMAHADELVKTEAGPVCTVLPIEYEREHTRKGEWTESLAAYRNRVGDLQTPDGNAVGVCPATYMDDITCEKCMLCAKKNRKKIVGFPAHGTSARKADAVATKL